jgi:hypothetical protein
MRPDHDIAALRAVKIRAVFNTNHDIQADAQSLVPSKRIDFENLIALARSKC